MLLVVTSVIIVIIILVVMTVMDMTGERRFVRAFAAGLKKFPPRVESLNREYGRLELSESRLAALMAAPDMSEAIAVLGSVRNHRMIPDKILWANHLSQKCVPAPTPYLTTHEYPPTDLVNSILETGLDRFAMKPSHLGGKSQVVLYDHGKDVLGTRPMSRAELVTEACDMFKIEPRRPGISPGIIVESLVPCEFEIRCLVVWGRVVAGWVFRRIQFDGFGKTLGHGVLARSGEWSANPFVLEFAAPWPSAGSFKKFADSEWKIAVDLVEALAEGVDYATIDLMFAPGQRWVGNIDPYRVPYDFQQYVQDAALGLLKSGYRARGLAELSEADAIHRVNEQPEPDGQAEIAVGHVVADHDDVAAD